MENLQFDVVYEDGVFKPSSQIPLKEGQKVTITIQSTGGAADRLYGLLNWNGDQDEIHRFLDSADEGMWEKS